MYKMSLKFVPRGPKIGPLIDANFSNIPALFQVLA